MVFHIHIQGLQDGRFMGRWLKCTQKNTVSNEYQYLYPSCLPSVKKYYFLDLFENRISTGLNQAMFPTLLLPSIIYYSTNRNPLTIWILILAQIKILLFHFEEWLVLHNRMLINWINYKKFKKMINFTTGLTRSKAKYAQASATIHKLPPKNTHHCVIYNGIPTLVFSLLGMLNTRNCSMDEATMVKINVQSDWFGKNPSGGL